MTIKLSPKQQNVLHELEQCGYVEDMLISLFERKSYEALEKKGFIRLLTDDDGVQFWAHSMHCDTES